MDRQTHGWTDRQKSTQRQIDRWKARHRQAAGRLTDKDMGGQIDRQTAYRQAHRGRQMTEETDKSAGRQMD